MIVLLGVPGSGKTAVLGEIARRWERVIPLSRVDLDAKDMADRPPREIVIKLAFQMSEKRPQFGRIPFHHLMLCLAIVRAKIDTSDRGKALADVRTAIMADAVKSGYRAAIETAVDALVIGGLLPGRAGKLPGVLLRMCEVVLWRRQLRLGAGLRPRRSATQLPMNPHDLLVNLGVGHQDVVDELFCRAFLADLRVAYQRGLRAPGRTANCAVLLDNVDSSGGRHFLELLASCRAGTQGDPLLVVATSRTWQPSWAASWTLPNEAAGNHDRQQVRTPEQASLADWATNCAKGDGSWGYLIGLRNLTVQEVADLAAGGDHPLGLSAARFAHRLTHGHPLAVRKILDGLAGSTELPVMRNILEVEDATVRNPEPVSIAQSILDRMLGDVYKNNQAMLCNIAVPVDVELGVLGRTGQDKAAMADLVRKLQARLLVTRDTRPALDPWLRRLVLYSLAKVSGDDMDGWWMLHTTHRNHHDHSNNKVAKLYHGLALGEIEPVVSYLSERLTELKENADAHTWIDQLNSITCAPNRLTGDRTPTDRVEELTPRTGDRTLARLVVAKWLLSDPLADPEESLRDSVRRNLERMAEDAPAGYFVFMHEADRYTSSGSAPPQ
ncbi:MAG TPA: hypothetical protein VFV67_00910 [Actinophytocola sp.]|uniref:hypothetical protein n=1 Tax=Actinophytocola sp. TaxID=1872138 RepID=UPI002DBC5F34|nr:hypothetical protein [Actinophytocola sp.]HEU5469183.1 hypothetical protein [Actinophytocola sp.]